jgi:formylglycine-generating enzyme required for sulfatase activity
MFEWNFDWYNATLIKPCNDCAQQTPSATMTRVLRGGSWYNNSSILANTFRTHSTPALANASDLAGDQIGFRCAYNL